MAETAAAAPNSAPAASPTQSAPAQQSTQPAQQSSTAPAPESRSVDPADTIDYDALLKKQAFKFKSNGKERAVDSTDKLRRYLERGASFEDQLAEIRKQQEELSPLAQLREKLSSPDDTAAESALEELLGERLDSLAMRRIQKQMEREKSYEGLTPRETQLVQALEKERQERQTYEQRIRQVEEAKRAEQAKAEQAQALKALAGAAEAALKKAGLKGGALEPRALDVIRPLMAAMLHAGQEINPDVLAEKVNEVFDEQLEWRMSTLGNSPGLTKLFESMSDDMMAALPKSFEDKYKALLLKRHREGATSGTPKPVQTNGATTSTHPAFGTPEWWRANTR